MRSKSKAMSFMLSVFLSTRLSDSRFLFSIYIPSCVIILSVQNYVTITCPEKSFAMSYRFAFPDIIVNTEACVWYGG